MGIQLSELKKRVENKYIGFNPSTTKIKPVHIANGLFRGLTEKIYDTELLNKTVFWHGRAAKGRESSTLYEMLKQKGSIDTELINCPDDLIPLRRLLLKVVNADDGVFNYSSQMDSYTAGNFRFISSDRFHQESGELVASWLRREQSPLISVIEEALLDIEDPITILCLPLTSDQPKKLHNSRIDFDSLAIFGNLVPAAADSWKGLKLASESLAKHMGRHPNKLFRLRLSVLFASFVIVRHMANLELEFVPGEDKKVLPFLLDFSNTAGGSISNASLSTYLNLCQSISRFFGWAFGQCLCEDYEGRIAPLIEESIPTIKSGSNKTPLSETKETWSRMVEHAKEEEDPFSYIGQALFDMLAQETEGNPVSCISALGVKCGLLWPPSQSAKRFVVQQDTLEMLIRGAVTPGEVLDLHRLQDRLWERFGVVVGGRAEDEMFLLNSGVHQVDNGTLLENRDRFAERLSGLDFARILADGVLQIEVEGGQ